MNKRHWFIVFGYLFGLALVISVFARLDWLAFLIVLKGINLVWGATAAVVISAGISMRALRWNLITGIPLSQYGHFWRSVNMGYLGNLIFPARVGEALRIVFISRLAPVLTGQAMTSAVVDRVTDGIMLIGFMMLVLAMHGTTVLGSKALFGSLGVFGVAALGIGVFVTWGECWQARANRWVSWLPERIGQRVVGWYAQSLQGVSTLRRPSRLLVVGGITLIAFLSDYAAMWLIMVAFGWTLPFGAAITVGVFIAVGASLPSLPGHVGIYQVASLFALGIYGVSKEQAIAFSVILHVLGWAVIAIQGGGSMLSYGFSLSSLKANLSLSTQQVIDS